MFFRARSMESVGDMLGQIFGDFHLSVAPAFISGYLAIMLHFAPESWTRSLKGLYARMPLVIQAVVLAIVILIIIQVRGSDIVPFIYLQY